MWPEPMSFAYYSSVYCLRHWMSEQQYKHFKSSSAHFVYICAQLHRLRTQYVVYVAVVRRTVWFPSSQSATQHPEMTTEKPLKKMIWGNTLQRNLKADKNCITNWETPLHFLVDVMSKWCVCVSVCVTFTSECIDLALFHSRLNLVEYPPQQKTHHKLSSFPSAWDLQRSEEPGTAVWQHRHHVVEMLW